MMQGIVNSSATTSTTASAMDGVRSNIQKNQAMQSSIAKTMTMTIKHDDNNNNNNNNNNTTRIHHQSSSVPTIVSNPISTTTTSSTSTRLHYPYSTSNTTSTTTAAEAVMPTDDAIANITPIAACSTTTSIVDKNKRKRVGGTMIHPGRKK
jgi:hypothetical protein